MLSISCATFSLKVMLQSTNPVKFRFLRINLNTFLLKMFSVIKISKFLILLTIISTIAQKCTDAKPSSFYYSLIKTSLIQTGAREKRAIFNVVIRIGESESDKESYLRGANQDLLKVLQDNGDELTTTSITTLSTTTELTTTPYSYNYWYGMSTSRLVVLLLVSFSVPVIFMSLLFWRLRKERKYLSRNGALVYRETIIVPSYGVSNDSESGDSFNVAQMHSTLYDSPPDYDTIIKKPTEFSKREPGTLEGQINVAVTDEDVVPPPAYSTVHL